AGIIVVVRPLVGVPQRDPEKSWFVLGQILERLSGRVPVRAVAVMAGISRVAVAGLPSGIANEVRGVLRERPGDELPGGEYGGAARGIEARDRRGDTPVDLRQAVIGDATGDVAVHHLQVGRQADVKRPGRLELRTPLGIAEDRPALEEEAMKVRREFASRAKG